MSREHNFKIVVENLLLNLQNLVGKIVNFSYQAGQAVMPSD